MRKNDLTSILSERITFIPGHRQKRRNIAVKKIRCRFFTAAAAEIGVIGDLKLVLGENAEIPLIACENDRLCRRHRLQCRTRDTDKDLSCGDQRIDIRSCARQMHVRMTDCRIGLICGCPETRKIIAAANQQ